MRKDSRIFHQESFGMSSQRKHQSKAFFAQQLSSLPHIIKEESPQKQKSVYSYQDNLLSPQPRSSRKYLQKDQLQELKNISPDYTILENNLDNTVGGIMDNSITRLMPSFDNTVIIKDSLNNYTLPQPSQFNNNYRSQSTSSYQIQPNQNHQQYFKKILTLKATQNIDLQMQQAQSFATQDHQLSQNVQAYQQISQNSIEQPHSSNLNFMGLTARLSQSTFKLLDSYKPLLHKKQYDLEQIKQIPLSNMTSSNTSKIHYNTSNQRSTSNVKQSVQHQLPNKINDQFLQKKCDSNQQKSVVRQVIRRQMKNLGNKAGSTDFQNLNFNNDDIQHHLVSLENQSKDQVRKLVNKSRTLDIEQDNRESKQEVEQKRSQISKSTKLLLKSQSESRLSEVSNVKLNHQKLNKKTKSFRGIQTPLITDRESQQHTTVQEEPKKRFSMKSLPRVPPELKDHKYVQEFQNQDQQYDSITPLKNYQDYNQMEANHTFSKPQSLPLNQMNSTHNSLPSIRRSKQTRSNRLSFLEKVNGNFNHKPLINIQNNRKQSQEDLSMLPLLLKIQESNQKNNSKETSLQKETYIRCSNDKNSRSLVSQRKVKQIQKIHSNIIIL